MAAIKFDSLDPETQKRILEKLGDQVGDVAPPRRAPSAAEVGEKPAKTAAVGPEVGEAAPGTRPDPPAEVGGVGGDPGVRNGVKRYFVVAHPFAFAWLWGLLLFGCWWGFVWILTFPFDGSVIGYAGLALPISLFVLAWVYFWRKFPGPIGLKDVSISGSMILSLVVMFTAPYIAVFTWGIGIILPTAVTIYLYWRFKWGSLTPGRGSPGSPVVRVATHTLGGIEPGRRQHNKSAGPKEPTVSEVVEKDPTSPPLPPRRGASVFAVLIGIGVLVFGIYCISFGQNRDLNAYTHAPGGGSGNSAEASTADTTPPELVIESPRDGFSSQAGYADVWLAGRTEPGAIVMLEIEGVTRELPVSQDGQFGENINLLEVLEQGLRANAGSLGLAVVPAKTGRHTLRVTAVDAADNEAAKEIRFFFNDPADAVPRDYYNGFPVRYDNTLSNLKRYLGYLMRFVETPGQYKRDVLDCSESAAMIENLLQNSGFDAYIAIGPTPWGKGYHAWVIVKARDGTVAVEPTMWLGYPGRLGFLVDIEKKIGWLLGFQPGVTTDPRYFKYDHLYNDIYAAVRADGSNEEWDWWEELSSRGLVTCIPSVDEKKFPWMRKQ